MALISLDNVSKIYPKGTRPALDDINLDIERGDFVFLVGASGSGKTTLLSLLLREEEATNGEIRVAGNDLRRITNRQVPQYRRSLGFVFQDYKLLNNKTVWENVAFALEVIGTRRSTIKSLVPKVLNTVGLTGKEKNYPHELSGGSAADDTDVSATAAVAADSSLNGSNAWVLSRAAACSSNEMPLPQVSVSSSGANVSP